MEVFVDYFRYNTRINIGVMGEREEFLAKNNTLGQPIETNNPS
jgi:hypothetical protein